MELVPFPEVPVARGFLANDRHSNNFSIWDFDTRSKSIPTVSNDSIPASRPFISVHQTAPFVRWTKDSTPGASLLIFAYANEPLWTSWLVFSSNSFNSIEGKEQLIDRVPNCVWLSNDRYLTSGVPVVSESSKIALWGSTSLCSPTNGISWP